MTITDPGLQSELNDNLTKIAGLLLSEEKLEAVLELVVSLTSRTLPNTDGVSVTLRRQGRFTTAVYSNEVTRRVDLWQYATGEGPCLSAIEDRATFIAEDLRVEDRWPSFATMATEEGINSVLAVPFLPMGQPIGALNSYSSKPHAFDEDHVEITTLFAQQAAIVIANSVAYSSAVTTNAQLREALESREVIGKATGILMERERVSSEEAFGILRNVSQQTNRKLREVAEEVLNSIRPS